MLNRGYDPVCSVVIPEGNDDLIQDDLIEDFDTPLTQPIREPLRLAAISVHQISQSGAPERFKCRPDFNGACASGAIRSEVNGVPVVTCQEIRPADRHCLTKGALVTNESNSGVVGHV